jgi:UDP-GlcNAc:undecaprenyl-phosphate/decaprenyl-phosphate GlcNAc-1-phosphate transferase
VRDFWITKGWKAQSPRDVDLHLIPRPRVGGVAIYCSFVIAVAVACVVGKYFGSVSLPWQHVIGILLPGSLVFALGLYDDLISASPSFKFAVQTLAAIMLFEGGLKIDRLPVLFGTRHFGWSLGLPITIFWVLGITNAFNLIDGLDGLAAGSALFSTLVVFVVSIFGQSPLVSVLTIALAGSILGFLRFNFNPASIFLGDCGSLFIGFILSALALQGSTQKAPTAIAVAIPVVSFGLPLLETALSVLRRLIGGKPIFTADREHIHHKLLARGMSHRKVVIVLYAVSALFALLSLFLLWPSGGTLGLVLAVIGTGVWVGVQHLGYLEFGEIRRVAQRTIEQRNVFVNNLAIRKATETLRFASDYPQLCRALETAFANNDFDGFDLRLNVPYELDGEEKTPAVLLGSKVLDYKWRKPGCAVLFNQWSTWKLALELVGASNENYGLFEIYRLYNNRPLLVDINLLTVQFPFVLAEAVERTVRETVTSSELEISNFRASEAS